MSIFKDLGINFSKEPKEVQETKRLIKESEEKRDALIKALNQEEERVINSNKEHLLFIGEYIYKNYEIVKSNGFSQEISENYNFIKDNEEKLKEISLKKEDVRKRYDDEIDILKLNLKNMEMEQQSQQTQETVEAAVVVEEGSRFCQNCGAKNNSDAKFCGSCGAKLE